MDLQLKLMVLNKPMEIIMVHQMLPGVYPRDHINLRMEQFILASGLMDSEMVMVAKYGLMALVMKELGLMIKQMDMENSFMLMVMFMKEIGSMIRQRDTEPIVMQMELITMVIGLMISNTVMVKSLGQMVPDMRVTILKARKRAKVSLLLLTEAIMMVNSSLMRYVDRVAITGLMRKLMKEAGTRTKWTALVFFDGRMARATKVNLSTTSVKARELSFGLMAASILDNGKVESSMVRVPTLTKMVK